MRYSRKLENQLCLLFGHTYRVKRGLKHIKLKPPIHDSHFKKKLCLYTLGFRFYGPRPNLDPKNRKGEQSSAGENRDRGVFA